MQDRIRGSIAWVTSHREWWLTVALLAAYAAALIQGSGHTRFHAICVLPVAGALLLAAIGKRHISTFAILSAAAIVPPAVTVAAMLMTPRPPHAHDCNPGPVIALFWLGFGVVQIVVMARLAPLIRGLALYVLRRPARSYGAR